MPYPEIYLVRHGETEWNVARRFQGQFDSRLTAKGEQQAAAVGRQMKEIFAERGEMPFYCSPLGRCRQTAGFICEETRFDPAAIVHDDLLMEIHCGHWETYTRDEAEEKWPEERAQRRADFWNYAIPGGGESGQMLLDRGRKWLDALPATSPMLAVAHGMIGMMIRGTYLGIEREKMIELGAPQGVIMHLKDGEETLIECGVAIGGR